MFREFESHSFRQLPVLFSLNKSLKYALSHANTGLEVLLLYQSISLKLAMFGGILHNDTPSVITRYPQRRNYEQADQCNEKAINRNRS